MRFHFTLLLLLSGFQIFAQASFSNGSILLPTNNYSGIGISVADMNGDGMDDIVQLNNGTDLRIMYQTGGMFSSYTFGTIAAESQWSMVVADIDNNGYNDILCGGRYDGIKYFHNNGLSVTMQMASNTTIFSQNSNFADINGDGWADAFNCHDDGESQINGNDGAGNLVPADAWINMATVPVSDNSGNYGSIWSDVDNDGDVDLFIAKCRQGVTNPMDPRRINAFYENDGNNNYTENAMSRGLVTFSQAWTADFADIDNDGDMDLLLTNHDILTQILENDGSGNFTDITGSTGLSVGILPIQASMEDFDNDGYVDILIAGSDYEYWHNNGNKTFSKVNNIFDFDNMESFGIGDLNNDGFLDVYGGYGNIYTTPSFTPDKLWLNNGNSNKYFVANLTGTMSTINGLGARVRIHSNMGQQIREVRAGEGYGVSHTFRQHFGLGADTQIDSMIISWPSGWSDYYYDIPADQEFASLEGECDAYEPNQYFTDARDIPAAGINGDANLCFGDEDWFRFNTGSNTEAKVQLLCLAENYDLEIYNGSMSMIAVSSNTGSDDEKILLSGLNLNTDYYVRIMGDGVNYSRVPYCLHITKQNNQFWNAEQSELAKDQISVWPNPADDVLNIELTEDSAVLRIWNIDGKKMMHKEVSNKSRVDISSFGAGVYMIELKGAEETYRKRVVVK